MYPTPLKTLTFGCAQTVFLSGDISVVAAEPLADKTLVVWVSPATRS